MKTFKLIATKGFAFKGRDISAGETFSASAIDAAALRYSSKAKFAPRSVGTPIVPAGSPLPQQPPPVVDATSHVVPSPVETRPPDVYDQVMHTRDLTPAEKTEPEPEVGQTRRRYRRRDLTPEP